MPLITLREKVSGFNMMVYFQDVRAKLCAETVFVYKKDDLSFEVNVRGEPVLFNMEEVPDQSSFDLLD